MDGWIKVFRSIRHHWLWPKNKPLTNLEAWLLIIMEANFSHEKVRIGYEVFDCDRGEKMYSLDTWAKLFNWNKSRVRRFLIMLEKENMVELKTDTKTTHLKVLNYETYQTERNLNETQVKRKRNASETQVKPIEEREERKEREEEERETKVSCQLSVDPINKKDSPHEVIKQEEYFHEVCEVVNYLNLKIGKNRRPESKSSKYIRGRLREGYLVEDLKLVIDLKVKDWLHDVKMKKYLRSDTLFNSEKFDKYIDEITDSATGSAHSANLKVGDLITLEHLKEFKDDDVIICNFKTQDADIYEDKTKARYVVKSIRGRIKANSGEFTYVEIVN